MHGHQPVARSRTICRRGTADREPPAARDGLGNGSPGRVSALRDLSVPNRAANSPRCTRPPRGSSSRLPIARRCSGLTERTTSPEATRLLIRVSAVLDGVGWWWWWLNHCARWRTAYGTLDGHPGGL